MASEERSPRAVTDLYRSEFVPSSYLSQYYSHVDQEEQFFLSQLHNFFRKFGESEGRKYSVGS